jgi:ATP-dependent DNA helicase PIF1
MTFTLNKEQKEAFEAVQSGQSVFITGSAGTGKSHCLKAIIADLKSRNRNYAVTSSTGCAAVLIGGQTVHSYLGLGIGNNSIEKIIFSLQNNRSKYRQIEEVHVLIIDEISMLDDSTFTKISKILQAIKNNKDVPCGGVQMILVGDFCQLSPVSGAYCFKSDTWKALQPRCIQLVELIRQRDDKEFQEILQEVRLGGKCSDRTIKIMLELSQTRFPKGQMPTRLFPLNTDVNAINNASFNALYKKLHQIEAADVKKQQCWPLASNSEFETDIKIKHNPETDIYRYLPLTNDKKLNLDDYTVDLFKGLQVMVTRNINLDAGIINGTTGIITTLSPTSVTIKSGNKNHVIYYHKDVNDNNNTHIKFMPIKLAYALSIHKAQGATLDAIEVDGSDNIFAAGQLYTALSRARDLKSIRLLNFNKSSFICNPDVKEFYTHSFP